MRFFKTNFFCNKQQSKINFNIFYIVLIMTKILTNLLTQLYFEKFRKKSFLELGNKF